MRQFRWIFAALALLFSGLAPLPASAAMAPAGLATAADQVSPLAVTDVRWGRGGGRGFRGGYGGHRGFRGGFHAPRAHFRPYRAHRPMYRPRPMYYGYGRSCIRRGWVWNGYRNVWRRYRVC